MTRGRRKRKKKKKRKERERGDEKSHVKGDRVVGQVDNSGHRPFIPPQIWTVNDFYPTMSQKVFNTLHDCHQIPKHIPFHLPRKFERCYSRKMTDIGMHDAMFIAGLRLPLTELHHKLANYLGLFVSQLAPNTWRIFIGAEVIWGQLSGGNCWLTINEFFFLLL